MRPPRRIPIRAACRCIGSTARSTPTPSRICSACRVDAAALLPKDDEADGFDNVASVLTVSPSFLDQYISAARAVTLRALGAPAPRPGSASYRPARADQSARVEGLPLGTRGGLLAEHVFPADGDYTLHIGGLAIAGYVRGMEYRHTLIVTHRREEGVREPAGRRGRHPRPSTSSRRRAVAAINGRFQNIPLQGHRRPAQSRRGVRGPDLRRVGRRAARVPARRRRGPRAAHRQRRDSRAVHADRPERHAEPPARARLPAGDRRRTKLPCATRILSSLARRAFRRPVTAADLDGAAGLLRAGRAQTGDFEAGIREALPAILASPKFLYRAERAPAGAAAGTVHRVTDLDLASRLSFFLTARPPDDELLAAGRAAARSPRRRSLEAQVAAAARRSARRTRWSPASPSSG